VGSCANYGASGCGIFTSMSGSAPNRIFTIEWRTVYFNNNAQLANFEVRLYEGQTRFDVIYDQVDQNGLRATIGVQGDGSYGNNTQVSCNTARLLTGWITTYTMNPCQPTPTPTATRTFTPVP